MATQSRIGGLTVGAPSTVAPPPRGPAIGGYIVIPFTQKRAGFAGLTVDAIKAPFDMHFVSATGEHRSGTDATNSSIRQNAGSRLMGDSNAAASFMVHNEATAIGSFTALQKNNLSQGANTVLDQVFSVLDDIARADNVTYAVGTATPVALSYEVHAVFAVRGWRYEPDTPPPTSTTDPYYTSGGKD